MAILANDNVLPIVNDNTPGQLSIVDVLSKQSSILDGIFKEIKRINVGLGKLLNIEKAGMLSAVRARQLAAENALEARPDGKPEVTVKNEGGESVFSKLSGMLGGASKSGLFGKLLMAGLVAYVASPKFREIMDTAMTTAFDYLGSDEFQDKVISIVKDINWKDLVTWIFLGWKAATIIKLGKWLGEELGSLLWDGVVKDSWMVDTFGLTEENMKAGFATAFGGLSLAAVLFSGKFFKGIAWFATVLAKAAWGAANAAARWLGVPIARAPSGPGGVAAGTSTNLRTMGVPNQSHGNLRTDKAGTIINSKGHPISNKELDKLSPAQKKGLGVGGSNSMLGKFKGIGRLGLITAAVTALGAVVATSAMALEQDAKDISPADLKKEAAKSALSGLGDSAIAGAMMGSWFGLPGAAIGAGVGLMIGVFNLTNEDKSNIAAWSSSLWDDTISSMKKTFRKLAFLFRPKTLEEKERAHRGTEKRDGHGDNQPIEEQVKGQLFKLPKIDAGDKAEIDSMSSKQLKEAISIEDVPNAPQHQKDLVNYMRRRLEEISKPIVTPKTPNDMLMGGGTSSDAEQPIDEFHGSTMGVMKPRPGPIKLEVSPWTILGGGGTSTSKGGQGLDKLINDNLNPAQIGLTQSLSAAAKANLMTQRLAQSSGVGGGGATIVNDDHSVSTVNNNTYVKGSDAWDMDAVDKKSSFSR